MDITFQSQNTRMVVQRLVDSCVQNFLDRHASDLDRLDMAAQLALGDRVRDWKRDLEDRLCRHLATHSEVTAEDIHEFLQHYDDK